MTNGLDRYSGVSAFNRAFYNMRLRTPGFLSDVAYQSRIGADGRPRYANRLAKEVIDFLSDGIWAQVYGLSYTETMHLSYAEWCYMQQHLNQIRPLSEHP